MAATATAGAAAPSLPKAEEHMDPRRLIAFFAMVVGMFMAILESDRLRLARRDPGGPVGRV